jgi:hypothetical protein
VLASAVHTQLQIHYPSKSRQKIWWLRTEDHLIFCGPGNLIKERIIQLRHKLIREIDKAATHQQAHTRCFLFQQGLEPLLGILVGANREQILLKILDAAVLLKLSSSKVLLIRRLHEQKPIKCEYLVHKL